MNIFRRLSYWWQYRKVKWDKTPAIHIKKLSVDATPVCIDVEVDDAADVLKASLSNVHLQLNIGTPCRVRMGQMGEERYLSFSMSRQLTIPMRVRKSN